jgi:hypothetical protein
MGMKNILTSGNLKSGQEGLMIAIFFMLIWMPLADSFLGLDKAQPIYENHPTAPFPQLQIRWGGAHDFFSGLEAYYRDHFGYRKQLVTWDRSWKLKLFKDSPLPTVILGRNGWLYFDGCGDGAMIEFTCGLKGFSSQELRNWQILMEKRRDWLAQRHIKYLFVIAPDKESIYPEFLPKWMIRTGSFNKQDQFFAYMKTHSTVEVVDLRPALLKAKQIAADYLANDTHWNLYGAFVGCEGVASALSKQIPGLKPLGLEAFEWKIGRAHYGDLAFMLGEVNERIEPNFVECNPRPSLPPLYLNVRTPSLAKRWDGGDKRLSKWDSQVEMVVSECGGQTGKAIVFHDSFGERWFKFLCYHFQEVLFVDKYVWDGAFIEREKPDVVIDEMVERTFNTYAPEILIQNDTLQ